MKKEAYFPLKEDAEPLRIVRLLIKIHRGKAEPDQLLVVLALFQPCLISIPSFTLISARLLVQDVIFDQFVYSR